jgi:hypothetical protein
MFILHADHELNCSTAAMRHISSSMADPYTAVAGAAGALYGPLHGGANEVLFPPLSFSPLPSPSLPISMWDPYKTEAGFVLYCPLATRQMRYIFTTHSLPVGGGPPPQSLLCPYLIIP